MKAPETPLTAEQIDTLKARFEEWRSAMDTTDAASADRRRAAHSALFGCFVIAAPNLFAQLADQQTALAAMREEFQQRLDFWFGAAKSYETSRNLWEARALKAESALAARPTLPAEPPPPQELSPLEQEVETADALVMEMRAKAAAAPLPSAQPPTASPVQQPDEPRRSWPDPTPEMLESPQFEAIWQCMKRWDVNVPDVYVGYMGATGNHVRAILDALQPLPSAEAWHRAIQALEELRRAEKYNGRRAGISKAIATLRDLTPADPPPAIPLTPEQVYWKTKYATAPPVVVASPDQKVK